MNTSTESRRPEPAPFFPVGTSGPTSPAARSDSISRRITASSGPYSCRMNTQPSSAPTAAIPSSRPSSTRCGCSARICRSLNVPGSDSSALQITYFGVAACAATSPHFRPAGKPAPPIPRSPESCSAVMT